MRRYELKDKERQAAYEKWLKDFDHHLQIACEGFDDEEETVVLHHLCKMTDKPLIAWELTISKKEIELVEEYDPHSWNKYPEVTPPERVLMQIEGRDGDGDAFHFSGYFKNRMWVDEYGYALATNIYTVERFRPWDEETAE